MSDDERAGLLDDQDSSSQSDNDTNYSSMAKDSDDAEAQHGSPQSDHGTIYSFKVKNSDGADVSLDRYRGKVVIIVNTATGCGSLTDTSFKELKDISEQFKKDGLEIACFPCNQIGNNEPRSDADIKTFVKDKFKFDPDLYRTLRVNGDLADPLFKFLKEKKGGTLSKAIKKNFTMFLIDRRGHVIKRSKQAPHHLTEHIKKALNERI